MAIHLSSVGFGPFGSMLLCSFVLSSPVPSFSIHSSYHATLSLVFLFFLHTELGNIPLAAMDALSSSIFISRIPDANMNNPVVQLPLFAVKPNNNRLGTLKINQSFNLSLGLSSSSQRIGASGSKVLAVSKAVSGESPENHGSANGHHSVFEDIVGDGKANAGPEQGSTTAFGDAVKMVTPLTAGSGSGSGGTRAGLFRTPISGGVQSATSAHGLPRPALAVRNLMEQARFAHLCTVMSRMHHRRQGYPFGSLVDFAPDSMGHPIFSFSPLAIHTRNLLADPRCTLVVQIPGWSGLSNARVTIFGDVFPLPEDQQEWAHKQYIRKHQQGPSQQWGNFYYFRMQNISDIYFIGGFGTVAWVDVKEYEELKPDKIALEGGEQYLKELNAIFSKPLKEMLSTEIEVDDAALISIDSKGTDVRVRQGAQFNVQRISFEEGQAVETLEEAKAALQRLINKGRLNNLPK